MPNHGHPFLRTPEANLSRGMQYLLSGYANWFNRRQQRVGHVFQGRFKGERIADASYSWTVSRHFAADPGLFAQRRSAYLACGIAAWLARRLTTATLRELAPEFGLSHPDSVSNLTRRMAPALAENRNPRRQVDSLRRALVAPE